MAIGTFLHHQLGWQTGNNPAVSAFILQGINGPVNGKRGNNKFLTKLCQLSPKEAPGLLDRGPTFFYNDSQQRGLWKQRGRHRLPAVDSRPHIAPGLQSGGGFLLPALRPGGVAGGQRPGHHAQACGVLQRHLLGKKPLPLRPVLGGGLRRGQLRPVSAPRLLPGPAGLRPAEGHHSGPALCRPDDPHPPAVRGGGRRGQRGRGRLCQLLLRHSAGAVRKGRPVRRPPRPEGGRVHHPYSRSPSGGPQGGGQGESGGTGTPSSGARAHSGGAPG